MSTRIGEITKYYWACDKCDEVSDDYESEQAASREAEEHEEEEHND